MISRMPKDPTIEAQLKKNIQNKENLLRELDAKLQSAKKECPHTRFAGQKNNLYNGKG